jgi:hypothetical protein
MAGHYNQRDPKFQRWVRIQLLRLITAYVALAAALYFVASAALAAHVPLREESAVATFDIDKLITEAANEVIACKYFGDTVDGTCELQSDRLNKLLEIRRGTEPLGQGIN